MRKKTLVLVVALVAASLVLAACAGFVATTKKQLYAWKEMWLQVQDDLAAKAVSGKIDLVTVEKFRVVDEKFRAVHHSATTALSTYETVSSAANKERVYVLVAQLPAVILEAYNLYTALKLPMPAALAAAAVGD